MQYLFWRHELTEYEWQTILDFGFKVQKDSYSTWRYGVDAKVWIDIVTPITKLWDDVNTAFNIMHEYSGPKYSGEEDFGEAVKLFDECRNKLYAALAKLDISSPQAYMHMTLKNIIASLY